MKKVCIDPGHQKSDPGAMYQGLKEKDVVLNICNKVARKLQEYEDYEVISTRPADIDLGPTKVKELQKRCEIANKFEADIFVSVHANADLDDDLPGMPEAKGEEIWYYAGSKQSKLLAECLKDEVDSIFPNEPFRGIKPTTSLYVLKFTNMPAVLIEVGFIDKSSSTETFTNPESIDRIADLVSEGIDDYFTMISYKV